MSTKRTHIINGNTFGGVTRGGGSETIEYVSNGPMKLDRGYSIYTPALGLGVNVAGQGFMFQPSGLDLLPGSETSENDVRSFGTRAMNVSRPGYQAFNILTSAGELKKDGLPTFPMMEEWKRKARFFKNLSDAHLSYQFGWKPFVNDVVTMCHRVRKSNDIIAHARSRSGNGVHVGLSFPPDESVTSTYGDGYPAVNWVTLAVTGGNNLKASIIKRTYNRSWFEGDWQGFIPSPEGAVGSQSNPSRFNSYANEVLGAKLTPTVLWNLAPWSWLVDWSTGFDQYLDVISNIMVDGMVLRNGFVMSHYRKTSEITLTGATANVAARKIGPGSMFQIYETKRRFPSVPYFGFNTPASYSLKQLSILAALGISRA